MTPVDDLVRWLTEVWDEDVKRFSSHEESCEHVYLSKHSCDCIYGEMLARIAADRKILALHREVGFSTFTLAGQRELRERYCDVCQQGDEDELTYPCPTLRLLASAFSDRPGYQESWAVQ